MEFVAATSKPKTVFSSSADGDAEGQKAKKPRSQADEETSQSHSHTVVGNVESRRPPVKHNSAPPYASPLRQHQRGPGSGRRVKESLNARSEYVASGDDGSAQHQINQYVIKDEIGRGSFGAVHLATDQYGKEYAMKEFSKSRLRKRAQSHIFRKPRRQAKPSEPIATDDFNFPLFRHHSPKDAEIDSGGRENAVDLIKEEIAVMKKLNHPNLCGLIEVLDDPREDSLYMVMEMCKRGIIMKVGVDERYDPYDDEHCRHWFRDLILGIEYLHAQGIVHRDIKPDNCLLTESEVLKVVDFGVSEMFEKDSEMLTAKSAGSPAFTPPELCVIKHGDVSGKSADIWSMGITLYCLKYGRLPFEAVAILELYDAIQTREPSLESETDADLKDLFKRLLEKDPEKRIEMPELREHPWVTKQGSDPLLSEAENTKKLIDPPTDAEMERAITGNVGNLLTVVKAVNIFKRLVADKQPPMLSSILGKGEADRFSQPPLSITGDRDYNKPPGEGEGKHEADKRLPPAKDNKSSNEHATESLEVVATQHSRKGVGTGDGGISLSQSVTPDQHESRSNSPLAANDDYEPEHGPAFRRRESLDQHLSTCPGDSGHRGHAHDPRNDHPYLYIGPSTYPGTYDDMASDSTGFELTDRGDSVTLMVSESPGPADIDIYETAYKEEIERIRQRSKDSSEEQEPTVYLNRRVDSRLQAVGQFAGRFMAKGEDRLGRITRLTRLKSSQVRVSEVSKALHLAAREEYRKTRQESARRQEEHRSATAVTAEQDTQDHKDGATMTDQEAEASTQQQQELKAGVGNDQAGSSAPYESLSNTIPSPTAIANRAMERGHQASHYFRSFVGLSKSRSHSAQDSNGDGDP